MTLVAEHVRFSHQGSGVELGPLTVEVRPGRITAVVGPSGCGKTSLVHLLAGLLCPDSGAVHASGEVVRRRRGRLPGHTALVDQDPASATDPTMPLRRVIALPARLRRMPVDVDALALEVGLDPALLDHRGPEVSGGQLQRACLARALAQQPRYLLADEITAHLDPTSTAVVTRVLRSRADNGLGVLAVTHDLELAREWADDIVDLGERSVGSR